MRYFKRVDDDSLDSVEIGKIYKEDDVISKFYNLTVAQSVASPYNSSLWKEVSEIEYIKQQGWCIRGAWDFYKWLKDNPIFNNPEDWLALGDRNFYHLDDKDILRAKSFNKGVPEGKIEVTIDQLNEIYGTDKYKYNIKTKEQMENFEVKVTPTTSKILQELAFENGWKWRSTEDKEVRYLDRNILAFEPKQKALSVGSLYNAKELSLEEAINRITTKEESLKEGDYAVVTQNPRGNIGEVVRIVSITSGTSEHPIRTQKVSGHTADVHNRDQLRKATDEEIKSALIKEAKRRGYKAGVTINSFVSSNYRLTRNAPFSIGRESYNGGDNHGLRFGGSCIYSNGKWTEIVNEPKEIFGFKIEKIKHNFGGDDKYQFGCEDHVYTKGELRRVTNTLCNLRSGLSVGELVTQLEKLYHS